MSTALKVFWGILLLIVATGAIFLSVKGLSSPKVKITKSIPIENLLKR